MKEKKKNMNIRGFIKNIEFIIEFIKKTIKFSNPSIFHGI